MIILVGPDALPPVPALDDEFPLTELALVVLAAELLDEEAPPVPEDDELPPVPEDELDAAGDVPELPEVPAPPVPDELPDVLPVSAAGVVLFMESTTPKLFPG